MCRTQCCERGLAGLRLTVVAQDAVEALVRVSGSLLDEPDMEVILGSARPRQVDVDLVDSDPGTGQVLELSEVCPPLDRQILHLDAVVLGDGKDGVVLALPRVDHEHEIPVVGLLDDLDKSILWAEHAFRVAHPTLLTLG